MAKKRRLENFKHQKSEDFCGLKISKEIFKYSISQSLSWHTKKLSHFTMLLVVPLQIQAINPLIFRAQTLDVFLRGLYVF